MGDKENDKENEQPELDITDDLKETESESIPEIKHEEPAETVDPVPAIEAEPTTRPTESQVIGGSGKPTFKQKLKAFLSTKKGKVIAIISAVVLLFVVLFAIPATRYAIAGVFIKKDVTLTVLDQDSNKPVSSANVTLGTYTGQTDSKGKVTLTAVPVGEYTLNVEKKYYASASSDYLVPILSAPQDTQPKITATGRNVQVTVTNKVTGAAVSGASISISQSAAQTDEKGVAQIILPVKNEAQKGTVKASGYNDVAFEVTVGNSDDQKADTQLTPSGKIYFLSKRTGKIDVMKSDLDGSNPETVVAGTGKESDTETVLLSTTDWKYLALLASRDSDKAKLYLIDTSSGKLTTMDEGDASFQLVGWSGHQFVYQATRSQNLWVDQRQALKSFNAETQKLTTLDETQGSGTNYADYASENLGNQYIVGSKVIYTKTWDFGASVAPNDQTSAIMSVEVTGNGKTSLKNFSVKDVSYIDARSYAPGEIYYRAAPRNTTGAVKFYEYENNAVSETGDTNDTKFYNDFYPTYLISPSGKKTLWYEPRDGKNVIFVGDASGNNGKEIGTSDYTPYGWYSDDYILLSLKGSELYIMSTTGKIDTSHLPLKITDYHKPAITYPGYGGGYGGQ